MKKPTKKATGRTLKPVATVDGSRASVDTLTRELEAARARIALLEQQRDEAINRLEWAIDSLNGMLGAQANQL